MTAEKTHIPKHIVLMAVDTLSALFYDDENAGIGDVNSLFIGDKEYSLSSVKGLKEWFSLADKYDPYTKVAQFTTEGMAEWIKQGDDLAWQIRQIIPNDIKLYYCHVNERSEAGSKVMKKEIPTKEEADRRKYELFMACSMAFDKKMREKDLKALKDEAFKVLKESPRLNLSLWIICLCQNHMDLIEGAYGANQAYMVNSLVKLWRTPYYDKTSGLEYTFEQWSEKTAPGRRTETNIYPTT